MKQSTGTSPPAPAEGAIGWHCTIHITPGWEAALQSRGLATAEALFAAAGESLGKRGLAAWRERLRLDPGPGGETWYLKRYTRPPAGARREMRRSRSGARSLAGVEWAWMTRLAADGIPAVRPLALAEAFERSREVRSALLTQAVRGESLEALAARPQALDRAQVRCLLTDTAGLVSRFHAAGYVHRDLYLSHIFYDATAAGSADRGLTLIDLHRVLRPRWRRRRWIVKDLAALEYSTPRALVSAADRLRWLKRYLGLPKLDPAARRLVRAVQRKTRRIARHDARRR